MKTTTNKTPSLRVLQDIQTEAEYLEEHPELDNVFTFHCFKALPRSALYFDRYGQFCLVYPTYSTCLGKWRLLKYKAHVSPAFKRNHNKVNYKTITWDFLKKRHGCCVHCIIAEMFINKENLFATEVDHIDENKHNNRYDNLEYVTHAENMRRRYYNYYHKRGLPVPEKYQTPENYQIYLQSKNS